MKTNKNTDAPVTITISINLAAGDKWEGNAEFRTIAKESELKFETFGYMNQDFEKVIKEAINDYFERNNRKSNGKY